LVPAEGVDWSGAIVDEVGGVDGAVEGDVWVWVCA
jgi:hypothetical protein